MYAARVNKSEHKRSSPRHGPADTPNSELFRRKTSKFGNGTAANTEARVFRNRFGGRSSIHSICQSISTVGSCVNSNEIIWGSVSSALFRDGSKVARNFDPFRNVPSSKGDNNDFFLISSLHISVSRLFLLAPCVCKIFPINFSNYCSSTNFCKMLQKMAKIYVELIIF